MIEILTQNIFPLLSMAFWWRIVVTEYYFQIWNKKKHNIIISNIEIIYGVAN